MKIASAADGLLLGLLLGAVPSSACMHPPRDYPGKLGSTVQEYLFFREGDRVHMVANQRIASDRSLPGEVAWVIPLPAVPLDYRTENDSLFRWLFRATETRMKARGTRGTVHLGGAFRSLALHAPVEVGEYAIQPVEILDTASGAEINDWLFRNGYHRVPPEGLRYYLHPGACFLAVKVKNPERKEAGLRPLHVTYRSKEMRLPLKFFANAGVFDVYLYALEKAGARPARDGLRKWGLSLSGRFLPDSGFVRKAGIQGLPGKDAVLVRYFGEGINGKKNRIADWKEDPLILVE